MSGRQHPMTAASCKAQIKRQACCPAPSLRLRPKELCSRLVRCRRASRNVMAKAKKQTSRGRKQDRRRVAGGEHYEVRYEANKIGSSKAAVKKVGSSRNRVERRLEEFWCSGSAFRPMEATSCDVQGTVK